MSTKFEIIPEGNCSVQIRGLRLSNYRIFSSAETDFEPLTVFVGMNGSGKSSLIRAIATLPWTVSRDQRSISQIGGGSGLFHSNKNELELDVGYLIVDRKTQKKWRLDHHVKLKGYSKNAEGYRIVKENLDLYNEDDEREAWAESVRKIERKANDETSSWLTVKGKVNKLSPWHDFPVKMINAPETQLVCAEWPAIRFHPAVNSIYHTRGTTLRIDPTTVSLFRSDGRSSGWLENEASALWNFIYRLCNASTEYLKQRKESWLSNISRFLPWILNIKAQRDVTGSIRLFIKEKNITSEFHPADVSDGTLMLLGHLAILESGGEIVVVDEPEAHLHPDAIEELIQIYRDSIVDPNNSVSQVIIATQSPMVVRKCYPRELRVLERENFSSTIHHISEDPSKFFVQLEKAGMSLDEAWLSNLFGGVMN